ncbi:MAG TPA: GNAT family N-acetyltransferase [Candidatus Cryosericum sp.]|nr:GNAT family N-acetyltransferase [Candidatus Cryosericum sp.]
MADLPIIVQGPTVVLTPPERENVPTYWRWICDPEANAGLADSGACVTIENEYDWYDSRVAKASPESVNFEMHERNGMRLIGNCGIFDIDRAAGTAECGILIGEKDCWNHGYGTETMVLLARYAFDTLGLSNLMLRVYDFNEHALAAYRRAGFHEVGRRRRIRHGGRLVDEIIMDILPGEVPALP